MTQIWSMDDISALLKQKYPEVYRKMSSRKHWIQIADVGLIAIINTYGGLYIDIDVTFLSRVEFSEDRLCFVRGCGRLS